MNRMETLKRHLPFSGQEGLQELKKIAVRFEEKIYTAATSQVISHDFPLNLLYEPKFIIELGLLKPKFVVTFDLLPLFCSQTT